MAVSYLCSGAYRQAWSRVRELYVSLPVAHLRHPRLTAQQSHLPLRRFKTSRPTTRHTRISAKVSHTILSTRQQSMLLTTTRNRTRAPIRARRHLDRHARATRHTRRLPPKHEATPLPEARAPGRIDPVFPADLPSSDARTGLPRGSDRRQSRCDY